MYEYAATTNRAQIFGAENGSATTMEVGPSAAPMMAMEAASCKIKAQQRRQADSVKNMPNCAAAPNKQHLGIGKQRPEVDHRAYADEQQQREQLVAYTRVVAASPTLIALANRARIAAG